MPARIFFTHVPAGYLMSTTIGYLGLTRPRKEGYAAIKMALDGWLVVLADGSVLQEATGEVVVSETDIIDAMTGESIFLETQEELEDRVMRKTRFEFMTNPLLNLGPLLTGHWKDSRDVDTGLVTRPCLREELPEDFDNPSFRAAWEDTGTVVQVNMPKARTIHMDLIRQKRNAELAKLDMSFMIAVERNDKTMMEKISVQKQKLRDIPQTYDLSGFKTPEELKAFWPKELGELDERIKDVKKAL